MFSVHGGSVTVCCRHQFTLWDHGYRAIVHCVVCLFMSQLLLVLNASTHGGMARLCWRGWLVSQWYGLPIWRRPSVKILTGSDIDYLRWCDYQLSKTVNFLYNLHR